VKKKQKSYKKSKRLSLTKAHSYCIIKTMFCAPFGGKIKTGGIKKWKKESLVCVTASHTQPVTLAVT
jgi:hypothetical protein